MNIILATHNKGKVDEFERIFQNYDVTFFKLGDVGITSEPVENGSSFSQNAQIKLDYYLNIMQINKTFNNLGNNLILSEDSGIEIDALNGEPGVISARYGGRGLSSFGRNKLVLKKLSGVPSSKRKARFVCCIKVASIEMDLQYEFSGYCEGTVRNYISGSKGFGYDPIFQPLRYDVSMANLRGEDKDKISHRGDACIKLKEELLSGYER